MKNLKFNVITIALCLAAAIPVGLKAQHLEIGPFAGYETTGKVYTSLGYLRVSGGANFGGMVSFGLDEDAQFEFSYNHMNGTLSLDNGEHVINSTPVNVDYYMFGLVGATRLGDKWLPFYGGSLGWVHYGTPDEKYGNESLFAINIQAGMKFLISEKNRNKNSGPVADASVCKRLLFCRHRGNRLRSYFDLCDGSGRFYGRTLLHY